MGDRFHVFIGEYTYIRFKNRPNIVLFGCKSKYEWKILAFMFSEDVKHTFTHLLRTIFKNVTEFLDFCKCTMAVK